MLNHHMVFPHVLPSVVHPSRDQKYTAPWQEPAYGISPVSLVTLHLNLDTISEPECEVLLSPKFMTNVTDGKFTFYYMSLSMGNCELKIIDEFGNSHSCAKVNA